jgi:hypothetical protein
MGLKGKQNISFPTKRFDLIEKILVKKQIRNLFELMPSRCGKSPDNTNISHYINKISIFFPPFELITEW